LFITAKPKAAQHRGGAGLGGPGIDVGEPDLDIGDAAAVEANKKKYLKSHE